MPSNDDHVLFCKKKLLSDFPFFSTFPFPLDLKHLCVDWCANIKFEIAVCGKEDKIRICIYFMQQKFAICIIYE